jgi:DNA repair exonuclease SbcCD nuclease subunit
MTLRFIHTSDWHLGRPFSTAGEGAADPLRDARFQAIRRLADAARAGGAKVVLVAGDVFDSPFVAPATVHKALALMAEARDIVWHLIPGNHDLDVPRGAWEEGRRSLPELPENVSLHHETRPFRMALSGAPPAVLLPAPLRTRDPGEDPTAWMDTADTAPGALRLGLAHGPTRQFGDANPGAIDARRAEAAGLSYLALGDEHHPREAGPRAWYSGTPEPEEFRPAPDDRSRAPGGYALLVRLDGPGAPPIVSPIETAKFVWRLVEADLSTEEDVDALAAQVATLPEIERTVLKLSLRGALTLAAHDHLARQLDRSVLPRFQLVSDDREKLAVAVDPAELDAIDAEGVVRRAIDLLRAEAGASDPDRARLAQRALLELSARRHLLAG